MSDPDVNPATPPGNTTEVDVLAPSERPLLQALFGFLPSKQLLQMYRKHFESRRHLAVRITQKPLNKVQASDILESLDRLVDVAPGFVEGVVESFKALVDEPAADADPQLRWAWNRLHGVTEQDDSTTMQMLEDLRQTRQELEQLRTELQQEKHRGIQQQKKIQSLQDAQLQQADQRERKLLVQHQSELRKLQLEVEKLKQVGEQQRQAFEVEKKQLQSQLQQAKEASQALTRVLQEKQREVMDREKELRDLKAKAGLQQQMVTELEDVKARNLHLAKENRSLDAKVFDLEQELQEVQDQPQTSVPLDSDAMGKTLILHYQAFGQTPLDRLGGLIQAYDAALSKRFLDPKLLKASNSMQFASKKPKHLLLLGVEEMLYDAVSVRLHHLLASRLMKQHQVLSHLMPQHPVRVEVKE